MFSLCSLLLPMECLVNNAIFDRWLMVVCQPGRLYSVYAPIDLSPPPKSNYMSAANLQAGWITMPEAPMHIFHPFFSTKGVTMQVFGLITSFQVISFCRCPADLLVNAEHKFTNFAGFKHPGDASCSWRAE